MAKYNWQDTKAGFKTLLNRNAIIAVLFNIAYTYSNLMKNAFRSSVVRIACELPVSIVPIMGTIFSLTAFVFRVPIGSFIDKRREKLKTAMIVMNVARAIVYVVGYGMCNDMLTCTLTYIFDGIVFCFCAVAGPALMAISVDQKAMGSAYAIYMGLATMLTGTAKSTGLSLFNTYGAGRAGLVAGGVALLSAVIVCFLNANTLCDTLKKEQAARAAKGLDTAAPKKKKNPFLTALAGFSMAALPFAIVTALCSIEGSNASSFLPLMAKAEGWNYLTAQSICNTAMGAVTIVIGILCDFINPTVFVLLALVAKIGGNFLIGAATANNIFVIGYVCITMSGYLAHTLRICAMKLLPYSKQGSLSATIYVVQDVAMMFGGIPAGLLAGAYGYSAAFYLNTGCCGLALLIYIFVTIRGSRRIKREKQAAELK